MKRKISLCLAALMLVSAVTILLSGCRKKFDNETSHLILSTSELDEVFNPFFATSANDSTINAYTQLSLITSSSTGTLRYGDGEPTIALDYKYNPVGSEADKAHENDFSNYYTDYEFLIKNDVKYSDGSILDIHDILFNYYVYLDPCYTGATTMYSVDIQGLKAYRAQTLSEEQQQNSDAYFERRADARFSNLINWTQNLPLSDGITETDILDDIDTVLKVEFKKELTADWSAAAEQLETYQEKFPGIITQHWQVFLIIEGEIKIVEEDGVERVEFNNLDTNPPSDTSRDAMINRVFNNKLGFAPTTSTFKANVYELLVAGWATGPAVWTAFVAKERADYYNEIKEQNDGLLVKSIEGIGHYELPAGTAFNGKTYSSKHSVFTIRINGVDPKAIWNFAVDIVPMSYYTKPELNSAANGVDQFGVEFGDPSFMDYLKLRMVPVGAGPYKASTKNDFFKNNIVSMERNEHFIMGAPKIKYIDFKVIAMNSTFDAVQKGEVHFADPNAKPANRDMAIADKNLGYKLLDNLGYGYIGINAKYVKDLRVRQAFMHAMDTSLVLDYYTSDMASLIHRSMSNNSWAYPTGAPPFYTYDPSGKTSDDLIKDAGYTKGGNGIYGMINPKTGSWEELRFTFTLAGDTMDHPAYATLANAASILNGLGCRITVVNDNNALRKLSAGLLSVWAAAWSSTIDPDMYQVYHKDSQATSLQNWGIPDILLRDDSEYMTYDEKIIIDRLSDNIERARQIIDDRPLSQGGKRAELYSAALDDVMRLAIELPTYQRSNLFVYRKDIIDENSLNKDLSAFSGLLSKIWEVSFKK